MTKGKREKGRLSHSTRQRSENKEERGAKAGWPAPASMMIPLSWQTPTLTMVRLLIGLKKRNIGE